MATLPRIRNTRQKAGISNGVDSRNSVSTEEIRLLAIGAMSEYDLMGEPGDTPSERSPLTAPDCIQLRADDLSRALLTARAKFSSAVEFAVSRYRDADRAYRQVEASLEETLSSVQALFENYSGHLARCRENERRVLADLNVEVVELCPGSPVDENEMVIHDQIPTADPDRANTVAAVHENLFRYRDEHGLEQMIRSEVDVYVLAEDREADDAAS